jgi:SAM-dependent methyltransferase
VASPATLQDAETVGVEYAELVRFFDGTAGVEAPRRTRGYHRLVERQFRFHIPAGKRVLEIGCGTGDLLAALEPSEGVGIDVSSGLVDEARRRHPDMRFEVAAGELLNLGTTFDYVVLSDVMPYAHDLLALFERVRAHSTPETRVVIESYNVGWRPLLALAELLRLKPRKPTRNWVSPRDVVNLLGLSGFEAVSLHRRILFPFLLPLVSAFVNGFVGSLWPLTHLNLTYWIVARPEHTEHGEQAVTVVCPCRNEQGNIAEIIERLPRIGTQTELIFVEGGSTDDTRGEIERQIAVHEDLDISLIGQPGKGKGDAVRAGFAKAKHEVLMILDADMTVRPEELPKFYRALVDGRGELINGSRLVYDLEPGSMQFSNVLGNKLFSWLLRSIMGQHVKDTLCGTKVLFASDYRRIASSRSYFGEFDPFGDFDLLLGAARLGLRIVDVPIRYQVRSYGSTNIQRWRHGVLLARMTAFSFWKFKVVPVSHRRS